MVQIPQLPHFDPDPAKAHPVADLSVVAAAEVSLGVKLPARYVELVTNEANGGDLLKDSIPTSTPVASHGDSFLHLQDIFGVGGDDGIENSGWLVDAWGAREEDLAAMSFRLEDVVLFGRQGHDHYLFHYSQGPQSEPQVVYAYVEAEIETAELAQDFQGFLDRLVYSLNPTWLTEAVLDPKAVIDRLATSGWHPKDLNYGPDDSVDLVHADRTQTIRCYKPRLPMFSDFGTQLIVDTFDDDMVLGVLDDRIANVVDSFATRVEQ